MARALEYLHLAVGDPSPLAYSEILPDETRRSCLKFLLQALRFFRDHGVKVLRVMTGNGVSFRSHRYAKASRMLNCTSLDLIHRTMSDYVIHSTADIMGEVDLMLSYVDGPDWQVVFLTF